MLRWSILEYLTKMLIFNNFLCYVGKPYQWESLKKNSSVDKNRDNRYDDNFYIVVIQCDIYKLRLVEAGTSELLR